jgi:hypothetical protein
LIKANGNLFTVFPLFYSSGVYPARLVEDLKSVGIQLQNGAQYTREIKNLVEDTISPFIEMLSVSKTTKDTSYYLQPKHLYCLRSQASCTISK